MARRTLVAVGVGGGLLLVGGWALAAQRRRAGLEGLADQIAAEFGVHPAIVKATIVAESAWRPTAKNCRGGDGAVGCAWGLLQLTPGTARGAGYSGPLEGLFDPETNLRIGVKLMAQYQRQWSDRDPMRYRIAWRFGPGRAAQWPPQGEAAEVAMGSRDYRSALRRYGWTGSIWSGEGVLSGQTRALLRLAA